MYTFFKKHTYYYKKIKNQANIWPDPVIEPKTSCTDDAYAITAPIFITVQLIIFYYL